MFAKEYYKQISTLNKKIYLEFIYKYGFEIWIRPILRYINDLIWNPNFAWSSPPITWLKKKKRRYFGCLFKCCALSQFGGQNYYLNGD